jgi:uncharacterized protein YcgI (DUF1989 family)
MAQPTGHMSRRGFLGGAIAGGFGAPALAGMNRTAVAQPARPTATRRLLSTVLIPKQSGRAVLLNRDQRLKVINPSGKQVGDLFAFRREAMSEFIAPAYTITRNRCIYLEVGKPLYSNRGNPLLMFEEDTVNVHDLLYPACAGGQRPGIAAARPNCRDNMQAALRAVDVTPPEQTELVHPHNLFQNSPVIDLEGHIEIREPTAKAGDYVVLHAMDKLVVVVTACSVVGVVNGGEPRELLMEVYE